MGGGQTAGPHIGRRKKASAVPAYETTSMESMPMTITERTRFFFVMKRLLPHINRPSQMIST
jgi:hypothetical protein